MKIKYGHVIENELKYRWNSKGGLNSCSFTGIVVSIPAPVIEGWVLSIVVKEKMNQGGIREEHIKLFSPVSIDVKKGDMVFVSGKKRGDIFEVQEMEKLT